MQAIRNKLKTQKGASITFALLLFLVCAVISSVVIVAATTAAGRMSQLPQMDQRYYAVTSAANLLRKEIDDKRVTVEYDKKTKTTKIIKVETIDSNGIATTKDISKLDSFNLLTDASIEMTEILNDETHALSRDYTLTSDEMGESVKCDITETLEKDGLLTFWIKNVNKDPKDERVYNLWIIFYPNIKEFISPDDPNVSLTTLTWKFHSMRKVKIS